MVQNAGWRGTTVRVTDTPALTCILYQATSHNDTKRDTQTHNYPILSNSPLSDNEHITKRPASADRTARRQFQATGQPVSQTQWRHGCRATRRSVCNAGASNGGRSLCVQISREWSYPLPIYWYHSKRQLIALQLCCWQFLYNETLQQPFRPWLSKSSKNDKSRHFDPILRKLGAA